MSTSRRSSAGPRAARGDSSRSAGEWDPAPQPEPQQLRLSAEERETLVARLSRAFVLHGMSEHVRLLQSYAAAGRRGEAGTGPFWSDAYAQRWAAILQLPPYHELLPVRPAQAGCEACPGAGSHRSGKFSGGWVVKCDGCSREWLVLEAPSPVTATARRGSGIRAR